MSGYHFSCSNDNHHADMPNHKMHVTVFIHVGLAENVTLMVTSIYERCMCTLHCDGDIEKFD